MAKRKRYNDEFRAGAVLMLQAAGYPDQKGALTRVHESIKVPMATLSRWARGVSNPPPSNLVTRKKGEIVEKLDNVAHMILDSIDLETVNHAELRERMTAVGIVVDKSQLLRGGATANVNNRIVVQYVDDWRRADS